MAFHPLHLKSNGYPAVRRSSAETTLFLQQLGEDALERLLTVMTYLPRQSFATRVSLASPRRLGVKNLQAPY